MRLHDTYRVITESNHTKFDQILTQLCDKIDQGQRSDSEYYGKVAACVVDQHGNKIFGINHADQGDQRIHAERAAITAYVDKHGSLPDDITIITTLSPCTEHMSDRHGASCTDLIERLHIKNVYCGYIDPTQNNHQHKNFKVIETSNPKIRSRCEKIANTFLKTVD